MNTKLIEKYKNNWIKMISDYKLSNDFIDKENVYLWIFDNNISWQKFIKIVGHLKRYGTAVTEDTYNIASKSNNICVQLRIYFSKEEAELRIKKIFDSKTSPYDPVYISNRDNISIEQATLNIEKYKKDKATSKEGFLKRHGENEGLKKFNKFQKTSDSKSLEHYIKKLGQIEGTKTYNKSRYENSKRCVPYWIKHGYSESAAIKKVSEYQLSTAGVHRTYYEIRNIDDAEIDKILAEINEKKKTHLTYDNVLMENLPIEDVRLIMRFIKNTKMDKSVIDGYLESKDKLQLLIDLLIYDKDTLQKCLDEFDELSWSISAAKKRYFYDCWLYTNRNDLKIMENYDKRGKGPDGFHLDHMYSISQGYFNNIDPKIIGSSINLKFIPEKENLTKQGKCSISMKQLLEDYNNHVK